MSEMQIFQNRAFGAVRVVEHEGEPWFVAKDVCECLELTDVSKTISLLDDDEKGTNSIRTPGGKQDMLIVSEPGLYSLILRSRKPEAKAFKRWIVHEVIPSIRRTGGYGAPALPNFRNPAEAARAWADKEEQRLLEEQKRLALEQRMDEVRPKVVFAESIEVAKTSILVGEMAKLIKQATGYDIGQNRFFEWLRSRGYLHKDGSQTNMPTQRSMDAGWMEIKEGSRIGSSGESISPARRRSRARGKSTSSTCSSGWWSHEHPLSPPHSFTRGRGVPYHGRAQGSRRAISAFAALQEAWLELAVSDGLRKVWRQN